MKVDDELRRAAREHQGHFEHLLVPDLPPRTHHRGRVAAVVAIAALVVVVVVVVAVTRPTPKHVRVAGAGPTETSDTVLRDASLSAAPVLAPVGTPSGETLVSATSPVGSDLGFPTQLFGTAAADGTASPGLLVEFQPNPPGGAVGGSATTQVRGVDAALDTPKDAAAASGSIRWVEGDAAVTAIFRGMTTERAVSVLDALQARTNDLFDGFDPSSAPPDLGLLGERLGADSSPASVLGFFVYAGDDGTPDLEVSTSTHSGYPGYFRTWIGGRRDAQGIAVEPDAYGPYRLVTVAWPDGRLVTARSTSADTATLEEIARNVELVSGAAARSIVDELNGQLAALPTVASASTPSARVELHADGGRTAVCLRRPDSAPVCRAPGEALDVDANSVGGSATVGSEWLVWAGARGQTPTIQPERGANARGPLEPEVATVGQWKVAVASVPAGVDQVRVSTATGPNQTMILHFTRPGNAG